MLLLLSRLPWRRLTLLWKLNKVSHAIRALIGINQRWLEQAVWEPVQDWIKHDPIDTADNTGTYRCNKPAGAVKSSCQAMVYCSIDYTMWKCRLVAMGRSRSGDHEDYKCAANRTPVSQTAVFVENFNERRSV